jgi:hypothetical protein
MSDIAKATIPVVWQADLNHTAANTISGLKLTPNNDNLIIFHYTAYDYGVPGRFEKLDASNGNVIWLKTVTKPGERIALSGWVDNNENIYFGSSWSGYTLWKYNSTLSSQLGSYTGGTGFEYVYNIITDDSGNIYAAGHVGSWSGAPSTVVKLNSNCSLIWSSTIGSYTGSKDRFTHGLALDSNRNVFHVGHDYHPGFPACRGRIIGHLASNGAVFLNKLVDESNSGGYGVIADAEDKIYVGYSYNLWKPDQTYTLAERSAILKLNQNGSVVWKYTFDDVGMYLPWGCIVKHTDNSFYVAFNLHKNGTVYPGIAEIDSDGNLLWKDTIDKPGWEIAQSSFDADGDHLYLGLNNPNDGTKTQVLCLRKPVSEPDWSFVQISDTHIGADKADERLAAAIYEINKIKPTPRFVLFTGDIAEYAYSWTKHCHLGVCTWIPTCSNNYNVFSDIWGSCACNKMTHYIVPGNHDSYIRPGLLEGGLGCFNSFFNGGHNDYSFEDESGLIFVGLDSGRGAPLGNGLNSSQMDFLKALDKNAPKIVFMHHPLKDILTRPYWDTQLTDWIYGPWTFLYYSDDFETYCKENNVQLVLAGHTHDDLIFNPDTYPQYIQTPSAGKDGEVLHGYRIIEVKDGKAVPQECNETKIYNNRKGLCYSPANLHFYDSLGQHVGLGTSGEPERTIPNSFYIRHYIDEAEDGNKVLPETIIVFDPCEEYIYKVVGKEKGTYRLELSATIDGDDTVFEANGIPTLSGAVHQYIVDWDRLKAGEEGVIIDIDTNGDGIFERTITADSNLSAAEFDAPMTVNVLLPNAGDAVQDGITLIAEASDLDGVDSVSFCVREPNEGNGVPIGQENLAATFNSATGKWECNFNTTTLQDGYYVVLAKGVDSYGNEGWSTAMPFSIRNWAIITLLPSTPKSKAGRTMPVKFSLRIAKSVDPAQPFVYNEDLEIRIYKSGSSAILQRSVFGSGSTDYRIDMVVKMYMTNFKTGTKPATYVVEIWRPTKNFKVGSFTFSTVK